MADILKFPSPKAQGIAYLEREMRLLLSGKGADDKLIDFAIEELLRIYGRISDAELSQFSVELPEGLSDEQQAALREELNRELQKLHRENHRLTLELMAQLLLAEVRLVQQNRD